MVGVSQSGSYTAVRSHTMVSQIPRTPVTTWACNPQSSEGVKQRLGAHRKWHHFRSPSHSKKYLQVVQFLKQSLCCLVKHHNSLAVHVSRHVGLDTCKHASSTLAGTNTIGWDHGVLNRGSQDTASLMLATGDGFPQVNNEVHQLQKKDQGRSQRERVSNFKPLSSTFIIMQDCTFACAASRCCCDTLSTLSTLTPNSLRLCCIFSIKVCRADWMAALASSSICPRRMLKQVKTANNLLTCCFPRKVFTIARHDNT